MKKKLVKYIRGCCVVVGSIGCIMVVCIIIVDIWGVCYYVRNVVLFMYFVK